MATQKKPAKKAKVKAKAEPAKAKAKAVPAKAKAKAKVKATKTTAKKKAASAPKKSRGKSVKRAQAREKPAVPQLEGALSTSRPGAAVAGTTLFVPFFNKLRAFAFSTEKNTDFPSWHQDMAAAIVGVAAVREDVIAVDTQGNVVVVAAHGQVLHALKIDDAPRSVCGSTSGRAAVLGARAVHIIEDGTAFEIGFASPVAATFLDDDSLFVVGEGKRAARIGRGVMREVSAPPETIHAVCAVGAPSRVHALGASGRWTFENGDWSRIPQSDSVGPHIVASPGGTRIAYAPNTRAIDVIDLTTGASVRSCTWPAQMSRPEPQPISIAGLAYRGEDRLLVALGAGQANLLHLDTGAAEKIDPFADELNYSWVFIYGGSILVAG